MKKISRMVSCLMIICILAGTMLSVSATGDANVVIGQKLEFAEGNEPFIKDERTMMPLRAVAEALDASVYWFDDESGKRVQIVCYDTLLLLELDSTLMYKWKIELGGAKQEDGTQITLEVPATIHNDRVYVPLRAIAEAFEASITWDNPNRSAILIPKEKEVNNVLVSEIYGLPTGTLCSVYGVIERNADTGLYYLRSLSKNIAGEYTKIKFCSPTQTSMSDNTEYGVYTSLYWSEQLGAEIPAGMVIKFTGISGVSKETAETCLVLSRSSSSARPLGHYDEYMKSLGMDFEPFVNLAPTAPAEPAPEEIVPEEVVTEEAPSGE